MSEPGLDGTDAELADYYDGQSSSEEWDEPQPVRRPERLDVTISVRFSPAEIAAVRTRAAAAGLRPTAYIRRCVLAEDQPPIDRAQLSRSLAALTEDLENLRRAAG